MRTLKPSQTLLVAATHRARHQLLDRPAIFDDPVVLDLVPQARDAGVIARLGDSDEPINLLYRALFALRSRFTEDRLAEAAARGVRQYVMLGAGLDTFPWRQPDFAREFQIFAVDHPASLIETTRTFRERGFSRPPNLIRVPLDLGQKRLNQYLEACGFDPNLPTFCSVLGVTQYLDDDLVDDILGFGRSLKPSSEIVLTFLLPDAELAGVNLEAARIAGARAAELGEPWKTRPTAPAMIGRLKRLGFSEVFHLSPMLADARYFADRSDQLRAPRAEQLISGIV